MAAIEPTRGGDPSPPSDAQVQVQAEEGPIDLARLLACLQAWALQRDGRRRHYRIRSGVTPGTLPDAAQLQERLQGLAPPLPLAWREALLQGWPPALRGLHRIELVPGTVWVSIALGLKPTVKRRLDAQWRAPAFPAAQKRAIVVGAGLAGCAMADALARRGWRVTVLERSERIGGVVAEIPLLAQHPALSPGEDRRSRLLIAGLLASRRLAGRLGDAMHWCGRLQPMPLAQACRRTAGIPPSVAQPVADSDAPLHGVAGWQGIWYPDCALADPQRWWQRLLQDPALDFRFCRGVAAIRRSGATWLAFDQTDEVLASATVMILANQAHALELAGLPMAARGRLRHGRIQVAVGTAVGLPAGRPPPARRQRILGGSSYRLEDSGRHCVIGPLPFGKDDPKPAELPVFETGDALYHWRISAPAERLLLRDNLPMIGAVPDAAAVMADARDYQRNDRLPLPTRPSLHLLAGLGGRGLLWSVLGAEMIAAAADGEPPVVEPDLQEAVDPGRFLRRSLRRASAAQADGTKVLSS